MSKILVLFIWGAGREGRTKQENTEPVLCQISICKILNYTSGSTQILFIGQFFIVRVVEEGTGTTFNLLLRYGQNQKFSLPGHFTFRWIDLF